MKVVLYARVSTEEQREGKTIDSQVEELKKFIAEKSKDGWELAGEYKDDGWSGGLLERPELDRLRDDAAAKKFEAVIVNHVDRLARDIPVYAIIKRDLERKKVQVIFRQIPEQGPTGNLMANILASFAEYEKYMILDRTRRGRLHKAKKEKVVGTIPPYGYKYIKMDKAHGVDGYYEIFSEQADVVKKMFQMVARDGKTARDVSREFTHLSIPTPKGGSHWGRSTVLRILRNETYTGTTYFNKYESIESPNPRNNKRYRKQLKNGRKLRPKIDWVAIPVPRIIDNETFQLTQKVIDNNRTFCPRNGKRQYLLRGLIKCEKCGSLYHGTPCHGKTFYRCSDRDRMFPNPRQCKVRMVGTDIMDNTVWQSICSAVQNPKLIMEQVEKLHSNKINKQDVVDEELKTTEKNISQLDEKESMLVDSFLEKTTPKDVYQKKLEEISTKREPYQKRRDELLQKVNELPKEEVIKSVGHYLALVKGRLKTFSFEEKQKFLRYLVRGIMFDGTKAVIKAEIPLYKQQERTLTEPTNSDVSEGQIENTISFLLVRQEVGKQCLRAPLRQFSHP